MKTLLIRLYKIAMPLLIFLCVLLVVLRLFGVSVIFVSGDSMEPTYKSGELYLIAKADEYKRGDVVAVKLDNMTILKRIIAVEGDKVEIYYHCIFVNDEVVKSYIEDENWNNWSKLDTWQKIGPGEVFLLGDQRNLSADSRHFGTIKTEQILGRVLNNE